MYQFFLSLHDSRHCNKGLKALFPLEQRPGLRRCARSSDRFKGVRSLNLDEDQLISRGNRSFQWWHFVKCLIPGINTGNEAIGERRSKEVEVEVEQTTDRLTLIVYA